MKTDYTPLQQQALRAAISSLDHACRMMTEAGVPKEVQDEVAAIAYKLRPLLPKRNDWRSP